MAQDKKNPWIERVKRVNISGTRWQLFIDDCPLGPLLTYKQAVQLEPWIPPLARDVAAHLERLRHKAMLQSQDKLAPLPDPHADDQRPLQEAKPDPEGAAKCLDIIATLKPGASS